MKFPSNHDVQQNHSGIQEAKIYEVYPLTIVHILTEKIIDKKNYHVKMSVFFEYLTLIKWLVL